MGGGGLCSQARSRTVAFTLQSRCRLTPFRHQHSQ
jgi:hypothetical protein